MNASSKLARQLYKDDESRGDIMQRDGLLAYQEWLQGSKDAADTDTRDALLAVDRLEFAAEWNALVAEADEIAAERAEVDE